MSDEAQFVLPAEEAANAGVAEAFNQGMVLSTGEAAYLLTTYTAQRKENNPSFQMPPVVKKTYEYTSKFAQVKTVEALKLIREFLLERKIHQYEYGVLSSLMPETSDEAIALLPSLRRFSDNELAVTLEEMAMMRRNQ
mmetsp:Transcript_9293/g.16416  ORF Transcript_9293/g.16416 Transcript_9293/m.16416 type:complete len:138 (-) Transcript_9293:651-1064(-)|eukprot:CAMPEP_0119102946 /NCGR_PEP_ID=MMETSP1180-20130426/1522_1 /TAXON_ID=3052 ORGANISM="Chlamydomonas cf sp, Strain CCMP681" /NCGR_SAMPLE_ID=MMETSP1180 /ASSEMBLY_ACC=CAM_ASM_000741 /LENGTH=137 /DNA_ID=CAMNT_0007087331 /DNA_START=65 /DNA_END=478 /DNA_ORIENTATION=+